MNRNYEFIIFLSSSILAFLTIYANIPITSLYQVIGLIIVAIIFLLNKVFSKNSPVSALIQSTLLFLASFIVQIVILSTGGLFSIFLGLTFIFAVGTGLLVSSTSAIIFLCLSLINLILITYLKKEMFIAVNQDPTSTIIYLLSFMVFFPLISYITKKFYLKQTSTETLKINMQQVAVLDKRNDLNITINHSQQIISVNSATEQFLQMNSSAILGKPLMELIFLQNSSGQQLSLPLEKIFKDKNVITINNLFLSGKNILDKKLVSITVSPGNSGENINVIIKNLNY